MSSSVQLTYVINIRDVYLQNDTNDYTSQIRLIIIQTALNQLSAKCEESEQAAANCSL